ncbi:MAG: UDP-N-acetylglucosamine--N-acetylmuramyl-(pentapeptide) pyrophosphoryl-undecaprenol N-acetylglucosamine transferase [Candidatus Nanopelagicaceae bacterium]|nr:UDP-N-acetylglucosamine--N-acetylmuramyl-(pentapeptide) pyrophosphoryl-undecaprenol N-acetylglucosamine transferase [Candidatus Nanopelagicaceae bacterium]
MAKRIVLAGGGTAGHIEPALAVADAVRRIDPTIEIEFIGTATGLESLLVPQRGYRLRSIPKVVMPRSFAISAINFPFAIMRSVWLSRKILKGASAIIGFGGYVSASAYLGARLAGVPIAIHEANAKPGWANRLGRHIAKLVAVNFEEVRNNWAGSVLTGMPIRSALSELAKLSKPEQIKFRELQAKSLGLDPSRPIVALFGGSQGSLHMNKAIETYLATSAMSTESKVQIIHAVGINNPLPRPQRDYLPMAYFHDMAAVYGVADLLITRSGAVTCSELMTVGRFAILVPLPHGNGEQVDNAQALVDQGRAIMVKNEEFTGRWLTENLERVVATATNDLKPAELHLDAANRIAALVLKDLLGNLSEKNR